MNEEIRLIEELSLNAHPALNTMLYDGWYLCFAGGYTSRANSVNVLYPSSLEMADKIKHCEEIYHRQGLSTIFKITPLSTELDDVLAKNDYSLLTPTNIMVAGIMKFEPQSAVMISKGMDDGWQEDYFRINETKSKSIPIARLIHDKIIAETLCATVYQNDEAVACGLCVVEGGYAGLFNIAVSKQHRRKGWGRAICAALLADAAKLGAKKSYLQVVSSNVGAVALYKSLGFEDMYEYWYRIKGIK